MLNHVLVPLDGSTLAETALPEAKRILGPNGKITLVTAIDLPQVPLYGFDMPMAMVASSRTSAEETMNHARTYLENAAVELRAAGFQVNVVPHFGEAASVIIETAQKYHVDAIVICTHGRSGLSRWLFGSVTNKVLGAAPCPIYVVPNLRKHESAQQTATNNKTAPALG
ncbi:MAG: universal stress protein [Chloroflexi bacterium]|nr:universal stress protein [Chloroflexota bacterium]